MFKRLAVLAVFLFMAFGLLAARLGWLQLVKGDVYAARADSQGLCTINIKQYPRGDFLDCYNRNLTDRTSPALVVFPKLVQAKETAAIKMSSILAISPDAITEKITKSGSKPFVLKSNLTEAQIGDIKNLDLTGFVMIPLQLRYSSTARATHLIGFVGEPSETDIAMGFKGGVIGKSGLEKQYDSYLQGGSTDKAAIVVNESGAELSKSIRDIQSNTTDVSHDVVLTINRDYQEIAETAFAGKEGALVIMDVKNGDVLAMVSSPEYDPNVGQVGGIGGDSYLNKALAYYPPASVFKIILAAAALDLNLKTDNNFICNGSYKLSNGHVVSCWKEGGHGKEDMGMALANSCNPYFTKLGQQLGGETIMAYATKFGLREQKLIGYTLPAYYKTIDFNTRVVGDVANASIGEKGIRLSPLMVAQMLSEVANGGKSVTPRIVKSIVDKNGNVVKAFNSGVSTQIIKPEAADKLKKMLNEAVMSGTGINAANSVVSVGGKTGTSQEQGAWFAGFAPLEDPRWAVAIYVQDGTSGGKDGAIPFNEIVTKLAILEGM